MATSYADAVAILESVAVRCKSRPELLSEVVPLPQAIGRITARGYVSPLATPTFDSSAMDGFAVVSDATKKASRECPVIFRVQACTAAGDPAVWTSSSPGGDDLLPCVEIMTGASFPVAKSCEQSFDAVIKVEDVVRLNLETRQGPVQCIQVNKSIAKNAHKRFAGSDFDKGHPILRENQMVRPHHIMAMASVGFTAVEVRKKIRVGVWSTGCELASPMQDARLESKVMDANGPFLEAALRELGADVEFLGVLDDDQSSFREVLRRQAHAKYYDALITTGAVSKGKFDFVPAAIKSLGAVVKFHGVAMRPGHPVLFATLPTTRGEISFFGLPGNPVATAACMRFIVAPYLYTLLGTRHDPAIRATLANSEKRSDTAMHMTRSRSDAHISKLDHFKHGRLSADSETGWIVEVSTDQSPAKLRSFSAANCWCHIKSGEVGSETTTIVDCFPF